MSDLTVWLRKEGLGPELNAIEGIEASIKSVLSASPTAQQGEVTAITDVGTVVQNTVVGVITKAFPGATSIANEILSPLLTAVEKVAETIVGAGTTTAPTS